MKKTRWYCDRCDKEFYAEGRLIPVEVSMGNTYSDDYRREKREFCKDCFQVVREQILSVMLRKETATETLKQEPKCQDCKWNTWDNNCMVEYRGCRFEPKNGERWRMTKERAIELLKNFNQYDEPNCMGYWDCDECVEALYMGIEAIKEQPKPARWVHKKEISREYIGDVCAGIEYDGWQCSSCKTKVEKPYKPNWNYCPNCGARMESEE